MMKKRWCERHQQYDDCLNREFMESRMDYLEQRFKKVKAERDIYRGLLKVAKCPSCDGSGAIPYGDPADVDWEQCQWCYERDDALRPEADDD